MLVSVRAASDLRVAEFLFGMATDFCSWGIRSMASMARLKRSVSLLIANSIGVLILPFSLYPRTWRVFVYARDKPSDESARDIRGN